jgi:hypothetical protein
MVELAADDDLVPAPLQPLSHSGPVIRGPGTRVQPAQAEPDDETGSWGCTIHRLSPPGPQPAETSSSCEEPVRFYQMASGSETVLRPFWTRLPGRHRLEQNSIGKDIRTCDNSTARMSLHRSRSRETIECPEGPVALCVPTCENEDTRWVPENAGNPLCAEVAHVVFQHFQGTGHSTATPAPATGTAETSRTTTRSTVQPAR